MAKAKPVAAADPAKKTSDIISATSDEATVQMDQLADSCFWNDEEFRQGERVEVDGECYECSFGSWIRINT